MGYVNTKNKNTITLEHAREEISKAIQDMGGELGRELDVEGVATDLAHSERKARLIRNQIASMEKQKGNNVKIEYIDDSRFSECVWFGADTFIEILRENLLSAELSSIVFRELLAKSLEE